MPCFCGEPPNFNFHPQPPKLIKPVINLDHLGPPPPRPPQRRRMLDRYRLVKFALNVQIQIRAMNYEANRPASLNAFFAFRPAPRF
uniref:Uncharacterized protein n=1 Tax=Panagrellus redivivus TaxID=6233 RepID=A0A7E4ZZJ5_PANRE